jgi:DNA mismatch repair protein MutL
MPAVRKLPEEIIRRIAAGEVVERPASVLKELVENALDAGARAVTVEWQDAGRQRIRVTDDGHGMAPADARAALQRHATSKITSLDDLDAIATYGFRGEALPSIAAVTRFRLTTRPADAPEAWFIAGEGGKILEEGPCGAPAGTAVLVEDLFFNTPARNKFLKSDATERGLLLRTAEDAALSAGAVEFHAVSEGREVITLRRPRPEWPPLDALGQRLKALWSGHRLEGLKPVDQAGRFLTVRGWVSDVHSHQSTARFQRLFVNNRVFVSRRLVHAVYDGYRGGLPTGRHPVAVLFLEIAPGAVDVNVHPSKREVRFSNENEVYGFVLSAVQSALAGGVRMPAVHGSWSAPAAPATALAEPRASYGRPGPPTRPEIRARVSVPADPVFPPAAAAGPEESSGPMDRKAFRQARVQAFHQLDRTYILARLDQEALIFDQHAAAERVLYERLSDAAASARPHRQALLLPWVWETTPEAAALISDTLDQFARLGFGLEAFGARSFRVNAVPGALPESTPWRDFLDGLAEDLATGTIPRGWEALLTRAACRGSVKAGQSLEVPEMERVIRDLQSCAQPWSCPHGRPTFLRLLPGDLAKRFRRT